MCDKNIFYIFVSLSQIVKKYMHLTLYWANRYVWKRNNNIRKSDYKRTKILLWANICSLYGYASLVLRQAHDALCIQTNCLLEFVIQDALRRKKEISKFTKACQTCCVQWGHSSSSNNYKKTYRDHLLILHVLQSTLPVMAIIRVSCECYCCGSYQRCQSNTQFPSLSSSLCLETV